MFQRYSLISITKLCTYINCWWGMYYVATLSNAVKHFANYKLRKISRKKGYRFGLKFFGRRLVSRRSQKTWNLSTHTHANMAEGSKKIWEVRRKRHKHARSHAAQQANFKFGVAWTTKFQKTANWILQFNFRLYS